MFCKKNLLVLWIFHFLALSPRFFSHFPARPSVNAFYWSSCSSLLTFLMAKTWTPWQSAEVNCEFVRPWEAAPYQLSKMLKSYSHTRPSKVREKRESNPKSQKFLHSKYFSRIFSESFDLTPQLFLDKLSQLTSQICYFHQSSECALQQ